MWHRRLILGLFGLLLLHAPSLDSPPATFAQSYVQPLPGICSESDRFGVSTGSLVIDVYDVKQLRAGWYHSFQPLEFPQRPAGLVYAQVVRLSQDGPFEDAACTACPTWEDVSDIARLNPGSLWLIGNEPDRQDYVDATRYAELYGEFYAFLKAEDPTCQVGIGGVVQPTPIRLQYLDKILLAYESQNGGESMPVDVWNIHNYVLREGVTGWGCGVPLGTDPSLAVEYRVEDHDSIAYWTAHVNSMRDWMADRGYRDRPLIISEFGILMPEMYNFGYTRVRDFMLTTFDWMMTATDPETGYPSDGNRLVQAWAWYSLNDPAFEGWTSWNHLFDPATTAITALGLDFSAYTAPLTSPLPGTIDLQPVSIRHTRPVPEGGSLVTMTISVDVYNGGAAEATDVLVRFERDGAQAGEATIPSILPGTEGTASALLPGLTPGQIHQVTATVEADVQTVECDPYNNALTDFLLVPTNWVYLPMVQKVQ